MRSSSEFCSSLSKSVRTEYTSPNNGAVFVYIFQRCKVFPMSRKTSCCSGDFQHGFSRHARDAWRYRKDNTSSFWRCFRSSQGAGRVIETTGCDAINLLFVSLSHTYPTTKKTYGDRADFSEHQANSIGVQAVVPAGLPVAKPGAHSETKAGESTNG